MEIKTKALKLVDLRVYTKEQGVEVDDLMPKAIVFLNTKDNMYHNVINTKEIYPFMTRTPYSNTTKNGITYGTKLSVHNPKQIKDMGICAIECQDDFIDDIYSQEYIELNDLKKKIVNTSLYFKDREDIIKELINTGQINQKMRVLIENDFIRNFHYIEQLCKVEEYESKKLIK